jgi:LytS/YehU family sensor histidine kinase
VFEDFSFRSVFTKYIFWWLAWTSVHAYILTDFGYALQIAFADAVLTSVFLILSGVVLFNTVRFYFPTKENRAYIRIWSISLGIGTSLLVSFLLKKIFISNEAYLHFVDSSKIIRLCYHVLMTGMSTIGSTIYFAIQNEKHDEQRKDDAEKLAREAELTSLRQQLQPHFLFNSLNSISALAGSNPQEARRMIQNLSDFLRGTIGKDNHQLNTLQQELQQLNLYLQIEKVRFGHRLQTQIHFDENCAHIKLPALILQPIMENAIKFGLYDTIGEIEIKVNAERQKEMLLIRVSNPYEPQTMSAKKGTGFGLNAVNRRLHLLYGRTDLLKAYAADNAFYTDILIPITHEESNTDR